MTAELLSPTTAKVSVDSAKTIDKAGEMVQVFGRVTAQNQFGAAVTSGFNCIAEIDTARTLDFTEQSVRSSASISREFSVNRVAVANVKIALRNMITAQEVFYAKKGRYASSIDELEAIQKSPREASVTIRIDTAGKEFWRATGMSANPGVLCRIAIGGTSATEGEPQCR